MIPEYGIEILVIPALLPVFAVTAAQIKAIFRRDNYTCMFPDEHACRGKLTVHHIDGKCDDPKNIITVCHAAHWEHLHNGATQNQQEIWKEELSASAGERTEEARERGWIFPKD